MWEGPTADDRADVADADPQVSDLDGDGERSRLHRWLLEAVTHPRALVITAVVAVVCGGVVVLGEFGEPPSAPPSVVTQNPADSTQGSLSSRAVATDEPADLESVVREAVSADERLRVTAQSIGTEAGSWMLEAQPVDDTGQVFTVRFTVNGVVVEEVDRPPYRLLLNTETLALLPGGVGDGRPLIVTASAAWPVASEMASPATLVLPN